MQSTSYLLTILFLVMHFSLSAQNTKVYSGKVVNEAGMVMRGVSVIVQRTGEGTQTSEMGRFTVQANERDSLTVSFTGYRKQTLSLGASTDILIKMEPVIAELEVVQINVGYGTLDKKEVTTSVAHVSAKELLNVGGNSGALMAIQGKVAGLTISNTSTSDPNATPSVQMQGVSSRNAGIQPLYIINGVPGGNPQNINNDNIESIDVLQGGAAAAIYGTRGSNGVIIITTKKGTETDDITTNSYFTFDYPNNRLQTLSADEYVRYTSTDFPADVRRGPDYGARTDWFDVLTRRPAVGQKHSIQFSGGGPRTNYLASVDYKTGEGIDIRSMRKEYGAQLVLNHNPLNKLLNLSLNVSPRFVNGKYADYGGENNTFTYALMLNPTRPVYDPNAPGRLSYIENNNPLDQLTLVDNGFKSFYLDWSGSARINLLNNLSSTIAIGQSYVNTNGQYFAPSNSISSFQYNFGTMRGSPVASQNLNTSSIYNFDWTGNYSLSVDRHKLDVLGGYSYSYFDNNGFSASGGNFPSDAYGYNNLGDGDLNYIRDNPAGRVGSYRNDSKLIAFLGRATYSFNSRYYATASIRHEGSSKFGPDSKWGNFYGFSAAWRMKEESFLSNVQWINDMKLRMDYGVTGNQDFPSYQSLNSFRSFGTYPYLGTQYSTFGILNIPNPELQWETTESYNFGLDFAVFNNRISGALNYYIRNNKDLLGLYPLPIPVAPPNNYFPGIYPPSSGARAQVYANVGTMRNWGVQFQLNGKVIDKPSFKYDISLTGATLGNKLVELSNQLYNGGTFINEVEMSAPGSPGFAQRVEEGRRVGSFYMLKAAENTGGPMMVYDRGGNVIPANEANADDRQYVGNGLPKFTFSMGHTFTYKNADLSIFFRGAAGYDIFNTFAFYIGTPVGGGNRNVLESAFDPDSKYSKLTSSSTYAILSDYFLEDGSFIKLDNVSAGYTFNLKENSYLKSIRIYATGRNLLTFTKYTGGDPEIVPINGMTPGVIRNYTSDLKGSFTHLPSMAQWMTGIQFKF
ncbi:SusC/RagA family TonB-linked outer membrane protein [Sphingobacterium deserti]|uniref:TonB-dependent receptor plug n=1 Tax=Sphingobacterium deserti TaxID=1229276 RepID=A0A0B8T3C2_9SPHI|nr:SusC/RagA family TonB-linked outer membrane protein [Sphingobacterium deserti]KGE15581.1 TonB-dependent receptor plug [Sphingobacterium deserti]